ncbi:GNAT family N-acetyltransferase [Reyranella sp. CPCC 100927]|uniref:GNAT family N-acetyltransferase n=1 Tax=Reyranella sp. CPCC 100927 TaxID=2599616 RepID=UPI0011B700EF|nr:GNAT family N-acetyltransferase [Reyranella sp. CPCC 100927]TWT08768.1 GNAT family N-acetyltransferase [Reyranella sp. CPCC 100927]
MYHTFSIRLARRDELRAIQHIENTADLMFRRIAMPWVLAMQPAALRALEQARRRGWLWVATGAANRALGFALLTTVGGEAYLHQLSVLPQAAGRGVGSALIATVCDAARAAGHRTVLLSTYTGVPWNAPYYARRGFAAIPLGDYTRALRDVRATERRLGHPVWRRVLMRRTLRDDA